MRGLSPLLISTFLVVTSCIPEVDSPPTTPQRHDTITTGVKTSTTRESGSSTIATAETTTPLEGGPIDFGPKYGDILAVIGVSHDDALNLRSLPGPDHEILEAIAPLSQDLIAQGETWELPGAFWLKVDSGGTIGWVHMGFVAYLGDTSDATAFVVDDLNGYPVGDTMENLGQSVAEVFASVDPRSDVVIVASPTTGDLGEVTLDVIGLGDDATIGVRLHVFGEPTSEGFVLKAVELTDLCGRGVTTEGLCV